MTTALTGTNPPLSVYWVKSTKGEWLPFENFDLSDVKSSGVYMIWHRGNPSRVVYVGQGDIAACLTVHRGRREITAYSNLGLRVTWASVPAAQRDGVERYLADKWNPLVACVIDFDGQF
jgi:hypothetical protein